MTCKSKIIREFKQARAESLWPEHDKDNMLPVCGGRLHVDLEVEGGGPCRCNDYCYCESAKLVVNVRCERCRNPFLDERLQGYDPLSRIGEIFAWALERMNDAG
jgi:hypothetical protein